MTHGLARGRFCAGLEGPGRRLGNAVCVLHRSQFATGRGGAAALGALGLAQGLFRLTFSHQPEVNAAAVQIHPADLHPNAAAHAVADAGAFAAQLQPRLIKAKVLATQLRDVNQAFDKQRVQRHKQTKAGCRGHRSGELFTQTLAHVAALEPGFDVARCFVGAPFVGAAVATCGFPQGHLL